MEFKLYRAANSRVRIGKYLGTRLFPLARRRERRRRQAEDCLLLRSSLTGEANVAAGSAANPAVDETLVKKYDTTRGQVSKCSVV
jgi:hypothetical protein